MKKLFLLIGFVLLSTQAFGDKLLNSLGAYKQPQFTSNGDPIFIQNLTFGGSGCSNSDSTATLFDTNNDTFPDVFSIIFDNFIAQQGAGIGISERRKNCNIVVQLHLPQGFQFSIAQVQYNGYADLPSGVQGQQESTYAFPLFDPHTVTLRTNISGPFVDNYQRTDVLGLASLVWSPCGVSAPMNIRTQVALTGKKDPAAMTLDQILGKVSHKYKLQWRECT